ncbi:hypothetical protein GCM10011344_09960 [Dokdonia pacifica]|uniref:DUF4126 domain-containing protein n=1 Tax=Dokdonia pacifica TaxID=1627892 RepID=A0A238YM78_9FLAO|nr:DUF4126 domain-containing protein [Dokdonia pacifica]GGG11274.1 hypothetical protein GCM10011344_09960 [Dokdonia pacifica]SNR72265.1 protein of unknown function [Dokdonia pacifica]
MNFELIVSIVLGFSLAAAAGFRIFIPLLVMSLSAHYGWFPVDENWQWVGSSAALWLLGIAAVIETFAYFIPWLDNLLDTVSVPLAGIAGTLLMVATMGDVNPAFTWALAIVAGGGAAAAISGTTGATRLTSTATTGGIANPVVATAEAGAATTISVASVFSPFIALIVVLILVVGIWRFIKKLRRS